MRAHKQSNSGDFISLPATEGLNNSARGITAAKFDGCEQPSHTGGNRRRREGVVVVVGVVKA